MEVIRILVRSETQCCVKKFKGVNGRTTRTNETVCSPDMRQSLWTTTEATDQTDKSNGERCHVIKSIIMFIIICHTDGCMITK